MFHKQLKTNLHVSVRLSRVDACRDMPKKGARGTADDGAGKSLEEQERTDACIMYMTGALPPQVVVTSLGGLAFNNPAALLKTFGLKHKMYMLNKQTHSIYLLTHHTCFSRAVLSITHTHTQDTEYSRTRNNAAITKAL